MEEAMFNMNYFTKIDKGVYVKEDKLFRYRLIFPNKNPDGSLNWFNLLTGGSWGNLLMVFVIVCVMVGLVLAYKHDTHALVECCNSCVKSLTPVTIYPTGIPNF